MPAEAVIVSLSCDLNSAAQSATTNIFFKAKSPHTDVVRLKFIKDIKGDDVFTRLAKSPQFIGDHKVGSRMEPDFSYNFLYSLMMLMLIVEFLRLAPTGRLRHVGSSAGVASFGQGLGASWAMFSLHRAMVATSESHAVIV